MEKKKCDYEFLLRFYNNKTIKKELKKLKKQKKSPSINHLIVSIVEEYIMKEKEKGKNYLDKYYKNNIIFLRTVFLICLIYTIGMIVSSLIFPNIFLFLIICYSIIPFYTVYYISFNKKYPIHKTFFCSRDHSKCPKYNHYCKEIHPKCIYERLAKKINEKLYDPIQILPEEISHLIHKIPTSKGNLYFTCKKLPKSYTIDLKMPPNKKLIYLRKKQDVIGIVDKDFPYNYNF